ncbi:methyltransferase domain-containing protein [Streptomyces sp. Ac-502]|uniref:methyltransferase domain-containing protein n=1 Tax=Streptomyces sp. Ac-502 TaxID=3342801 RepID=UPI003862A24B
MTPTSPASSPTTTLLTQVAASLGRPVPAVWADAVRAEPRDRFLPGLIWLRDGAGGYVSCDRATDPVRWAEAAYRDVPIVTRITEDADGFQEPTSSASAPGTVLRMLADAALGDGQRVLEIGTGTGFHAALLAHRLGADRVVSVEIDPLLAETARANLKAVGHAPTVITGDGAHGHAPAAPYDRIICTCSVRSVPAAWLAQTLPGARLVVPWSTSWITYGTLVLTRRPDGTAAGQFAGYGSYMVMRGQRASADLDRDLLRAGQRPSLSSTALSPGRWPATASTRSSRSGCVCPTCGTPGPPTAVRRTPASGWPTTPLRPWPRWITTAGRPPPTACGSTGRAGSGTRSRRPTGGGSVPAHRRSPATASSSPPKGNASGSARNGRAPGPAPPVTAEQPARLPPKRPSAP